MYLYSLRTLRFNCIVWKLLKAEPIASFYVKHKILVFEILPDYSPLKIDVYV
jgi:hypothetical protein